MSVHPDLEIDWKGETYRIRPTNAILRRIEMQGVSIAAFLAGLQGGAPQMFVFAFIVAQLLKSAGAKATEDEVTDVLNARGEEFVMELVTQVALALVPNPDSLPGKPSAPGARKPRAKARKKAPKLKS